MQQATHIYMYISVYVNELYYELCIVTMRLTKITIFATIRTRKAGMIKKTKKRKTCLKHTIHDTRELKNVAC